MTDERIREIKLNRDGTWHLTSKEIDWLNGAADREAALRAQVEELTRELDESRAEIGRLKADVTTSKFAASISGNAAKARKLDLQEAEARVRGHHLEPCETCIACETERNSAEGRLARVVEALRSGKSEGERIHLALTAAKQPTQGPLGHPFKPPPNSDRCVALVKVRWQPDGSEREVGCGQPESAHQPTQEKPEGKRA